jgi:hypothetical protein
MFRKILIVLCFALTSLNIYAQRSAEILKPELGKKLGVCSACGMEVFEKMMTRVEISVDDSIYHVCGIRCALTINGGEKY